jgi:predicted amidophosphoribosyltransferase
MKIPCYENLLIKTTATPAMKNISTREEKVAKLEAAFVVNDVLAEGGVYDVLIVDDLYDSGSSLEVATKVLKQ